MAMGRRLVATAGVDPVEAGGLTVVGEAWWARLGGRGLVGEAWFLSKITGIGIGPF